MLIEKLWKPLIPIWGLKICCFQSLTALRWKYLFTYWFHNTFTHCGVEHGKYNNEYLFHNHHSLCWQTSPAHVIRTPAVKFCLQAVEYIIMTIAICAHGTVDVVMWRKWPFTMASTCLMRPSVVKQIYCSSLGSTSCAYWADNSWSVQHWLSSAGTGVTPYIYYYTNIIFRQLATP